MKQLGEHGEIDRAVRCEDCGVRKLALFQPLSQDEIAAAQSFRRAFRELKAGSSIFRQGSPNTEVYTLHSGWAYLYQNLADGGRQILRFVLPGDFFGFQADVGDGKRLHSARAITPVALCVFNRSDLLAMFKEHLELGVRLTWLTAYDEVVAYEHLASLGRRSAEERIAYLLLELFNRVRLREQDPRNVQTVRIPLTQELIADACGLTQVHVNRTMKSLQGKNILTFHSKKLHVPDPDRLAVMANHNHNFFVLKPML
jgi:CRP/FNR family transcriptional regulator